MGRSLSVTVGTTPSVPFAGVVSDGAGIADAPSAAVARVRPIGDMAGLSDSVVAAIQEAFESVTAGADPIGSATYPVPGSNVIFLATTGSDSNPGATIGAPKATLAAALAAVPAGGTIVVRGGVYHQGEIEAGAKNCTIQPYPGETVWFDGATTFTGSWSGSGPWTAPYAITYDRQLGKGSNISVWSGAATRTIVDQVWIDNTKLTPIADGSTTPAAGQFAVNQAADTLTIGSNPAGKTVRIVDLKFLLAGSGITLRGIGVRRYAQAMVEYRGAAVCLGAGSTIEQCVIEHCSIDALSIGGGTGCVVRRCTVQDTGHSGVMGDNMAGGIVEQCIIRRCNRNDFDAEPTTAGFKMTRTFAGLTIRFNHIEDVADGSGIWLDTTVSRTKIYGNTIIGTSALGTTGYRMKNGIEIEGSDGGVYSGTQYWSYVVGNRITDCRQAGVLIFDSGYQRIWNNSITAAVCVYLWQDYRENTGGNPGSEGTATQSPWHTDHIELVNNALIPDSVYLTQLRGQCNSDAAYKIAGGAMLSRITNNWWRPQGSGLMAYLSDAAGSSWSNRSTLAGLESTGATYGGPLAAIMDGNHQSDSAPSGRGVPIEADVAAATGLPLGYVPEIGSIWPELTLAS